MIPIIVMKFASFWSQFHTYYYKRAKLARGRREYRRLYRNEGVFQ